MLDLLVNDALEGVDIIARYRYFYAMLLADSDLYHDFITALELLEEDPQAAGTSHPGSEKRADPPDHPAPK